jgi:hypothetical protein
MSAPLNVLLITTDEERARIPHPPGFTLPAHGRYFSPLEPNRPADLASLYANNDVVLYDRMADPDETTNLAADPTAGDLVARLNAKLEALIDTEIGSDERSWVTERPNLLGWPTWKGDTSSAPRAS